MKYVLLFVDTEQFASDLAAMGPSERERAYDRVNEWFATHADKLRGGSKLKSPETATTVRLDRGEPVIIDGPFAETKELVAGYWRSPIWMRHCKWSRPGRPARSSRSALWSHESM